MDTRQHDPRGSARYDAQGYDAQGYDAQVWNPSAPYPHNQAMTSEAPYGVPYAASYGGEPHHAYGAAPNTGRDSTWWTPSPYPAVPPLPDRPPYPGVTQPPAAATRFPAPLPPSSQPYVPAFRTAYPPLGTGPVSADRRRSNGLAIIAFVTALAVLIACAVALRGVPTTDTMLGSGRTAASDSSAQPPFASSGSSPSHRRDASNGSWSLTADQVCANVSSALSSTDGWTDPTGSAPAELTALQTDQSTCQSGASSLSSTDLDAMSNRTIDALLAWYDDMAARYSDRWMLNYQLDGQWSDETKSLSRAFSDDGWDSDPTVAAQGAASLRSAIDPVKAHLDSVVSDLHDRESTVAGVTVSATASEQEIWSAIDTVAQDMGVTYDYGSISDCTEDRVADASDEGTAIAFFCFTDATTDLRNKITFTDDYPEWGQLKKDPWMLDATKHELAHRSISIMCGTTDPSIAGDRTEAVTNAYAFAFMGMDRQRTEFEQFGLDGYKATDADTAVAQKIHDGICE